MKGEQLVKLQAYDNKEMGKTAHCELCGHEVEEFEVNPHVYCVQYETMRNGCSIICQLGSDEEAIDMTRKREGPYVWATWLSRMMVGEACCQWAPWFKTHN